MRNNFSNIRNLYIIDLSCNVLDQKTLFDRKIETIQQLGHCSFQIQYKSPLLASLFSSFGFEEQHYKYFEKDNKKLLVEKNETDQDHYMNEARAKIEKIKSEVTEKIQIQIDVQVRQPCLIIKELDELHKKLNDIIRFLNNNHLNIDSDNYEYTELIKEAKYLKIKVITQINDYQIFRCNQDNLFFDLDQELSRLKNLYYKFQRAYSDNVENIKQFHNDLEEGLTILEELGKLRYERVEYSKDLKTENNNNWNKILSKNIYNFKIEAENNKNVRIKRINAGLPAILPACTEGIGGNKLENTLLKLSRYIKERQVAFHPTLRIRKAALEEINGNIVEYALNKVVRGKLSSTSTIQNKMRKLLVENVMESIQKKYEKFKMKTEKMEEILNKEEKYLHKRIASYVKENKIELGKDKNQTMVLLTVMVGKLVDIACKRAGSDLKKQSTNKKNRVMTIESSNVENIKSELFKK